MWFKRRKKSEQDDALSESLRSLQSLLSETDRHEPSLDPGRAPPRAESGSGQPGEDRSRAPETRADSPEGRPEAHGDDSNRWRDLSLSFDAEPVMPRQRRAGDTGDATTESTGTEAAEEARIEPQATEAPLAGQEAVEEQPVEAGPPGEAPVDIAANAAEGATAPVEPEKTDAAEQNVDAADESTGTAPHVQIGDGAPAMPEPDADVEDEAGDDEDIITYDLGAKPVPPPSYRHGAAVATAAPGTDADTLDEEILVLDLDAETASEPALPADEGASEASRSGPGEVEAAAESTPPQQYDDGLAGGGTEASTPEPAAPERAPSPPAPDIEESLPADTGREAEDQLNLELDADEAADADIPVLTNAVYVPAQASAEGAPASRHEPRIGECIDTLRARLQRAGLDPLTGDQERELHAALAQLFEDTGND